jgi:hypothetical protein
MSKSILIDRGIGLLCMHPGMPPDIVNRLNKLTQDQRDALHALRDKIVDGVEELHDSIPADEADPILIYFFGAATREDGQGSSPS